MTPLHAARSPCVLLAALLLSSCSEPERAAAPQPPPAPVAPTPVAVPVPDAAAPESERPEPAAEPPAQVAEPKKASGGKKAREPAAGTSTPKPSASADKPTASAPSASTPTLSPAAAPAAPAANASKPKGKMTIPKTSRVEVQIPSGLQADLDRDPRMQPFVTQVVSVIDRCHTQNGGGTGSIELRVTMHENARPDAALGTVPKALAPMVACATGGLLNVKMPLFTGSEGQRYTVRVQLQ